MLRASRLSRRLPGTRSSSSSRSAIVGSMDDWVDLSSVPRAFWGLIAPFEVSIEAPLEHDFLYQHRGDPPAGTIDLPARRPGPRPIASFGGSWSRRASRAGGASSVTRASGSSAKETGKSASIPRRDVRGWLPRGARRSTDSVGAASIAPARCGGAARRVLRARRCRPHGPRRSPVGRVPATPSARALSNELSEARVFGSTVTIAVTRTFWPRSRTPQTP